MTQVTQILERLEGGDPAAADELLPIVYGELRQLASQKLAQEPPGQTLQATALVHEVYLRLVGSNQEWQGTAHFFASAAEAMRRILVESARHKKRIKHGGQRQRVEFHDSAIQADESPDEILVVNDLFDRFAKEHPVEAELAKLRYFAGFNGSEAARAMGIPIATAHRYWKFARTWLYRELSK